jgi:hypothetical protein
VLVALCTDVHDVHDVDVLSYIHACALAAFVLTAV